MTVIALHGDFSNAAILKRDIAISHWKYCNWKRDWFIGSKDLPLIFAGYSNGGNHISYISHTLPYLKAAILYESPILPARRQIEPAGKFPVLWIENNQGRGKKNRRTKKIMKRSKELWAKNHPMTTLEGIGRHVKTNPLGHGWDQNLNPQILDWINQL